MLRPPCASSPPQAAPRAVTVSLLSADASRHLANATLTAAAGPWAKYSAELVSSETNNDARLGVRIPGFPGGAAEAVCSSSLTRCCCC